MATATKQDDDLLIIADDDSTSDSNNDIEFSFDFGEDTPKKESASDTQIEDSSISEESVVALEAEEIKTPDLEIAADEKAEEITEVVSEVTPDISAETDVESGSVDLWMSLDGLEEKVEESKIEENKETEDFSFDMGETTDSQETEAVITELEQAENQSTSGGNDSSMNDILAATIAKLASRKDAIATTKSGKAKKEEEIKVQIKDLQALVKELEDEMKALDTESDKITANISQLEDMKLDPVKEHNNKRVKK